jgi:hypothetical protein
MQRLSFLLVALCASAAFAADKPDLSSPKSAAMAFGTALVAGDSAGVKAATVGTEEEYKMVDAISMMVSSMKKLNDAADAKFGKDNGISQPNAGMDITKEIETSEIKVDGDVATVDKKDKNDKNPPMKLKKIDGNWKVDLSSLPKENMDQMMKVIPSISKAFTELATEITAGKYKTAMEAKDAMGQKMLAAMMSANPGALGAPPAPPAPPEK